MTSKASPISLGNSALGSCEDSREAVVGEGCEVLGMGVAWWKVLPPPPLAPRRCEALLLLLLLLLLPPPPCTFFSISFSMDSR